MTKNNLTYRVGELEKCYEKIDNRLDRIMENHLPHLQLEMEALKVRVNVLAIINIGSVILALIINKFL